MGGIHLVDDNWNGGGIHQLGNVMTLDPHSHSLFDELVWWLIPDPGVNVSWDPSFSYACSSSYLFRID